MPHWFILLLIIAVAGTKLGQGFDFDIKEVFKKDNRYMIFKGVLTTILLAPCLILLIIYIFQPPIEIMFALIVMSVCPSADLSVQQVTKLGGNVPLSAGVVAITSLISLFSIPIFLKSFETILNIHINVEAVEVIRDVAITIFLPMVIGMFLRKIFPNNIWLAKLITHTAFLLLVVMVILITIHNYSSFANFKFYGYSMLTIAVVGSYLLGVLMSGKKTSQQISLGIESALRNPGLAILIANHNFAAEKVLTATVPYVVTTIIVVILCTFSLKLVHKFIS